MHILSIGLTHTTAPVQLRERIAFSEQQARAALARACCSQLNGAWTEMVILSTCNRIEIYATARGRSFDELESFLADARGVPLSELRPSLQRRTGRQAARHLLKVAAGLDSLVLGEPQILGQVTRALELAHSMGSAGALLTRLFQSAIHAGKRARSETAISCNPASVSSLAAALCERARPDIRSAQVVILGAGEMAELAVEALRKRGAERLLVINRTQERAQALAGRWHAETDTFENLGNALIRADILIASTGAAHTLIRPEMVANAMRQRPERGLLLIDIAVPRDIEPAVTEIPNVRLHDIDNLNAALEQALAERAAEVPRVEAILQEEEARFLDFLGSLEMLPLIADMRQQAESIRQAELEKTLRHLPDLNEAERARIEALSQALVKKLLAGPTNHLRAEAASTRASEIATITRTLFNLPTAHSPACVPVDTTPISTAAD